MRNRQGFTMLELLVVMLLGVLMMSIIAPSVSRTLNQTRLQRAASVVASDLQHARTLAARQRAPVTVTILDHSRMVRLHRGTSPDTVFNERRLDTRSEYPLQSLTSSPAAVTVYPNGLSSANTMTITLQTPAGTRQVTMTRAGLVRIQ
jgi:prepilin-type N-terminal cleavage/methylation domain-containing protein